MLDDLSCLMLSNYLDYSTMPSVFITEGIDSSAIAIASYLLLPLVVYETVS